MRWHCSGFVLSSEHYNDKHLLVSIMTYEYGKKKALAKFSTKNHNKFSRGNLLSVNWSGKSDSSLGYFSCEVQKYFEYFTLSFVQKLAVISILELINITSAEIDQQIKLFASLKNFLFEMEKNAENWHKLYIDIEMQLTQTLGFAMDLSRCIITNQTNDLAYISPKTGQAISKNIGKQFANKLFALPNIFINQEMQCDTDEFLLCLKILGYFFKKHIFNQLCVTEPKTRQLLIDVVKKKHAQILSNQ